MDGLKKKKLTVLYHREDKWWILENKAFRTRNNDWSDYMSVCLHPCVCVGVQKKPNFDNMSNYRQTELRQMMFNEQTAAMWTHRFMMMLKIAFFPPLKTEWEGKKTWRHAWSWACRCRLAALEVLLQQLLIWQLHATHFPAVLGITSWQRGWRLDTAVEANGNK